MWLIKDTRLWHQWTSTVAKLKLLNDSVEGMGKFSKFKNLGLMDRDNSPDYSEAQRQAVAEQGPQSRSIVISGSFTFFSSLKNHHLDMVVHVR